MKKNTSLLKEFATEDFFLLVVSFFFCPKFDIGAFKEKGSKERGRNI